LSQKNQNLSLVNVALGLVRNSVFRKTLLIKTLPPIPGQNGNYNTPQNTFQNSNETTTEE
jgi:hypothetical protein